MDPRLKVLNDEVDAFFDDVHGRYADQMACGVGCSACCKSGIVVTAIESHAITELMSTMSADERVALVERAGRDRDESCAALDAAGRCMIYAARPLVCRAHGVPMRQASRLPVVACVKNFDEGTSLAEVPDEHVLEQQDVGAKLTVITKAFRQDQPGSVRVQGIRNVILRA